MDKNHIAIIFALVFAVVVRLYLKYVKKNKDGQGNVTKPGEFSSTSKDDDYEPYAKK